MTPKSKSSKKAMAAFRQNMGAATERSLSDAPPGVRQVVEAGVALSEPLQTKYLAVGAPYGETPEGFGQWMWEVSEASQLQRKAAHILYHHEGLAIMRRLGLRGEPASTPRSQELEEQSMSLTLELPAEVEQVLASRARARGVTLPEYLQDLAERDAQAYAQTPQELAEAEARHARHAAALSGYGKFAGLGVSVDDLLRERREEARHEMEREEAFLRKAAPQEADA